MLGGRGSPAGLKPPGSKEVCLPPPAPEARGDLAAAPSAASTHPAAQHGRPAAPKASTAGWAQSTRPQGAEGAPSMPAMQGCLGSMPPTPPAYCSGSGITRPRREALTPLCCRGMNKEPWPQKQRPCL